MSWTWYSPFLGGFFFFLTYVDREPIDPPIVAGELLMSTMVWDFCDLGRIMDEPLSVSVFALNCSILKDGRHGEFAWLHV